MSLEQVAFFGPSIEVSLNPIESVRRLALVKALERVLYLCKDIAVKAGARAAFVLLEYLFKVRMNSAECGHLLLNRIHCSSRECPYGNTPE
jgi:hypothetical protein